jgi:hypothetical protein
VDGRPYRGQLGVRKVADPKEGEASATWPVELEPGRHTLKVLADTEFVQGASDEVEARYQGGGLGKVELPTLYVLAVGISKDPGTRRLADFEEKDLSGSALDAEGRKQQLAGVPGRLTLILDACHSGATGTGRARGTGDLTDQLVRDLTAEESGLVVMCSALGGEQAQESHKFRHGLFTVALLEGLQGKAGRTKDGAVYLTALDADVAKRVKELSKGQQNPVTGKPTSARDFPVSKP